VQLKRGFLLHETKGYRAMKTITFDDICESQDFDHDQKFVTLDEVLEIVALAKSQFDIVKMQRDRAHEFLLKTSGDSQDKRYMDDPDYWHDLGWEKDLTAYFKKYAK